MKGKYLSQKELKKGPAENKKRPGSWLVVLLLAAVVLGIFLYCNGAEILEQLGGTTVSAGDEVQNTQPKYTDIETFFGTLQIDEEYMDKIRHVEVSEDDVTMEVFYMVQENGDQELFRICFGDATRGTTIGEVQIDGQNIPVSVVVCSYADEDFSDEETRNNYYTLMDQLNVVIDSIQSNSSFTLIENQTAPEVEKQLAELIFWSVELPINIAWEESTSNQAYRVDFFGNIDGERIPLYTISLGDKDISNAIGMYEIDGGKTPVSVKTYGLESQNAWIGEEYSSEYAAMMETINDVIQVITADENFSEDMP